MNFEVTKQYFSERTDFACKIYRAIVNGKEYYSAPVLIPSKYNKTTFIKQIDFLVLGNVQSRVV